MNPSFRLLAILSASLVLAAGLQAQTVTHWDGGTGNWSDIALWDNGVPNGAGADVFIDGGKTGLNSVVTMDGSYTVGRLTVDAGDTLNLANNVTFSLASSFAGSESIINNGTINFNSTGSGVDLRYVGANASLTGSGTINLLGAGDRIFAGNGNNDRLTIGAGSTIAGAGNLGAAQSSFTNNGLINANLNGQTLTIEPGNGGDFTNGAAGVAQASNGGILSLRGNNFVNGTFQALAGSSVAVGSNAVVNGATLATAGSGTVTVTDTATLVNVTNSGLLVGANNSVTFLAGTFTNNGVFNLNSTGSGDDIRFANGAVLAGTGTINLNGVSDRIFAQNGNNDRLIINAGATIAGAGNLGIGNSSFTNNGTVNANQSGLTLTLQPGGDFTSGASAANLASNGGTLALIGGSFVSGKFQALAGSTVTVGSNAVVNGATLATAGSGTVTLTDTATLSNVTNSGLLVGANNSVTFLAGTFTNNGVFNLNSTGSGDDIRFANGAVLAGTGTINLNGASDRVFAINGSNDRLTINAGATVAGAGNLGIGNSSFTNNGTVNANQSGLTLTLQPGGDFTNGSLAAVSEATNGGALALVAGTFNNGVFQAFDGSSVTIGAGANVVGSTLASSGTGAVVLTDTASLNNVTNVGVVNASNNSITYLFNTLTNNGTINLNSTGSGDDIRFVGAGEFLNGTGTINLNGVSNRIYAKNGNNDRLTIGPGETVAGTGNLGIGQSSFTNNGTVNANQSGKTLILQPGGDFTNGAGGLAEATGGGTLALVGGGSFVGAGFQALDGSQMTISGNPNLNGVTLSTAGAGTATILDTVTLTNSTNNGTLVGANNSITFLTGTLTNNGVFNLNSTGSGDDIRFTANGVILAGTGTINLNGPSDRIFANNGNNDRLIINAGATVAGTGNLGLGQSSFTNNGAVTANQSGKTLAVQLGGDFTNGVTGVASATGGGTLTMTGGSVTNNGVFAVVAGSAGGASTLAVDAGRLTNVSNSALTGGVYNVLSSDPSNTATLTFGGGPISANAANVVLSGAASVFSEINALAVNSGSFTVANGRNFTTAGGLASSGILVASGGSTLTATGGLASSGVLRGDGRFASPSLVLAGTIAPGGTVSATTGDFTGGVGTLTLAGTTTLQSGTDLTLELGASAPGASDRLSVIGAFTLDGRLDVTALAGFGAGRYDLIDYTGGALTDNVLELGTLPSGYTYAIDTSVAGQVDLVVTLVPEPSSWAAALAGLGLLACVRRRMA